MVSLTTIFSIVATALAVSGAPVDSNVTDIEKRSSHYKGTATYFYQGGNAGACGSVSKDSSHVVALQTHMYANGKHCGKKVKLTNTKTGKSVTATVKDECPTCNGSGSIDLSVGAFTKLASKNAGVFPVKWTFV